MRPPALLCSLALGLGVAGGLAACGSSDEGRIPASDADRLETRIQRVQSAVDLGDCEQVANRLQQISSTIEGLPSSVDGQLVARLREGVVRLGERASTECQPTATTVPETIPTVETLPTTTEEAPPTITEEAPPTVTEEAPAPTTEEPPAPVPTEETPAPVPTEETPAPEAPDDGSGDDGGTGGIAPAF